MLHGPVSTYTLEGPGFASSSKKGTLKALGIDAGAKWSVTVEAPGSVSYREQVLGENEIVQQLVLQARAAI